MGAIYTLVEFPNSVSIYSTVSGRHVKPGALNMLGSWSKEGYNQFHKNRFVDIEESNQKLVCIKDVGINIVQGTIYTIVEYNGCVSVCDESDSQLGMWTKDYFDSKYRDRFRVPKRQAIIDKFRGMEKP